LRARQSAISVTAEATERELQLQRGSYPARRLGYRHGEKV